MKLEDLVQEQQKFIRELSWRHSCTLAVSMEAYIMGNELFADELCSLIIMGHSLEEVKDRADFLWNCYRLANAAHLKL